MANLTGKSLGRYQILEQLGEGGMAIVYKAYDTRLEADVAVKFIRTDRLPPEFMTGALKRFEREAKALAQLTHPNLVKVQDYGDFEGQPYLVMPYLPGGTLKEKMQGHAMPWEVAARLLIPVARALDYAHSRGMIHRDVKPSNILMTESGEPMLTDFGVAKILDESSTLDLTGTNATIGTPEYMAPEQVVSKNVDHRADIYALGVVFYEMVTGRRPFTADTPMAVLFKHASEPLPRPKTFMPSLPDAVEKILIKALAKQPEDRYQSMNDFRAALERVAETSRPADRADATLVPPSKPRPEAMNETVQESAQAVRARLASAQPHVAAPVSQKSKWTIGVALAGVGLLVMLAILCVGIGGFIQAHNARATDTAVAQMTASEQARVAGATATEQTLREQGTATAQAYQMQMAATAQARLDTFNAWNLALNEQFNDTSNGWSVGDQDNEYYSGSESISGGKLVWTISQSKQGFVHWDWPTVGDFSDFYYSVDVQRASGPVASACYGLRFRGDGFNYYVFEVCDNQTYKVLAHSEADGWTTLVASTSANAIDPTSVNRLAVAAVGSQLEFYINNILVNAVSDSSWTTGNLGIMIEMNQGDIATFEFDNFIVRVP